MSDGTKIEWTEATWNPITGCSIATTGCAHCYAMKLAGTRLRNHPSRAGLTIDSKNGPVWTGEVRFNEAWLTQPLQWKRPRMIFVCAHGDLFHESVPDAWIDRVVRIPWHTYQVLTKRAERMRAYFAGPMPDHWPLPNVWIGVSAERQQEADARIPHLLDTPAAVRWLSAEPLLGPIDLTRLRPARDRWFDALRGIGAPTLNHPTMRSLDTTSTAKRAASLDWVVVGGESGDGARPIHPDWARSLRDQCAAAGVAFFFKQWGQWLIGERVLCRDGSLDHIRFQDGDEFHVVSDGHDIVLAGADDLKSATHLWRDYWADGHGNLAKKVGKKAAGRLLDGIEHNDMPERAA